jgi:capsular polysaccharide biosynthesis protein
VDALAQAGPVDRVIFAGSISYSFGHFLLETLALLWICRLMPGVPIAWTGGSHFNLWQLEILDILGVGGPHLFIQFPERFNCVVLPEVGYRIHDFFGREHCNFLGAVRPADRVKGRRAWISRSRLSGVGHVLGEEEIEGSLEAEGWEIYHPQEHKVIDQLRHLSSCEDIAGWEGSAFHSLVLLKKLKTVVHIFQRGHQINENYVTIANTKRFVQHVHAIPLSLIKGEGSKKVWELAEAGPITDILRRTTRQSPLARNIQKMSRRIEASLPFLRQQGN